MICNCSSHEKMKIERIVSHPQKELYTDSITGKSIKRTKLVSKIKRLEPNIKIIHSNTRKIEFSLQGNITSGGHSINNVKKIKLEKEDNKNEIVLKYYVEIKRVAGKESANVNGYNYFQNETFAIPKNTTSIKIQLYERYIDSKIPSKLLKELSYPVN